MVLTCNIAAARSHFEDGLIMAAVTVGHASGESACCKRQNLMPEANTEYGAVIFEESFDLLHQIAGSSWIAGTVGE